MERALYLAVGLALLAVVLIGVGVLARSWIRSRLAELIELLRLWHSRM